MCTSTRDLSAEGELQQVRLPVGGGGGLGRNGETVDTYETLHNSVEREGHLVRVRGTNYFPILWPAKI